MGLSDDGTGSLDLTVRRPGAVISASGDVRPDQNVVLTGSLVSADEGSLPSLQLLIEAGALADVGFNDDGDGNLRLTDPEGTSAYPIEMTGYTEFPVLDDRYRIHVGSLHDLSDDRAVDFFAISDPIHVILIAAAVLVAKCLLSVTAVTVVEYVQMQTTGFSDNCRRDGGFPFVRPEVRVRFALHHLGVGCEVRANAVCRGGDGRVLHTFESPWADLHGI